MSRAGWLSRYRSEFQPTELAGMSCDHKVDTLTDVLTRYECFAGTEAMLHETICGF